MLKDMETVQGTVLDERLALPVNSLTADLDGMPLAGGLGAADSAEYVRLSDFGSEPVS